MSALRGPGSCSLIWAPEDSWGSYKKQRQVCEQGSHIVLAARPPSTPGNGTPWLASRGHCAATWYSLGTHLGHAAVAVKPPQAAPAWRLGRFGGPRADVSPSLGRRGRGRARPRAAVRAGAQQQPPAQIFGLSREQRGEPSPTPRAETAGSPPSLEPSSAKLGLGSKGDDPAGSWRSKCRSRRQEFSGRTAAPPAQAAGGSAASTPCPRVPLAPQPGWDLPQG